MTRVTQRCLSKASKATLALALLFSSAAQGEAQQAEPGEPSLDRVLERLNRVALLYMDQALHFTCDEDVTNITPVGRKNLNRFAYTYVYSSENGLDDRRMRRSRGGEVKTKGGPVELREVGLPSWMVRSYSWVFIFREESREQHRFELLGLDEETLDQPALALRFQPIPPYQDGINEWFGTAWLDPRTYQLLRVEAMQAEEFYKKRNYEAGCRDPAEQASADVSFKQVRTDFGVEKNGMRFPSASAIERKIGSGCGTPRPERGSQVWQKYSNYRFYSVRTAEEIEHLVLGEGGS